MEALLMPVIMEWPRPTPANIPIKQSHDCPECGGLVTASARFAACADCGWNRDLRADPGF